MTNSHEDAVKRLIYGDKRRLTASDIHCLVEYVRTSANANTLAANVLPHDAEEISKALTFTERKRLALKLLDRFKEGWRRLAYNGQIVDYTRWRIGQITLTGGRIGVCPVCGKKGEVNGPYLSHFHGETVHKVRPFFMGVTHIEECPWRAVERDPIYKIIYMGCATTGTDEEMAVNLINKAAKENNISPVVLAERFARNLEASTYKGK